MKRSPLKPRIVRNRKLRAKVLAASNGICAKCGRFDAREGQADHIHEIWCGGKDDIANLQWLCRHCHGGKTAENTRKRAKTDRLRERSDLTRKRRAIIREKEEAGS